MRIGIDATVLHGEKSGIATYTEELTHALARNYPGDEFIWFSNRAVEAERPLASNVALASGRGAFSRAVWMQAVLPRLVRTAGIEVFHFTNSLAPVAFPRPYVVTLHDLSVRLLPECHTWKKRMLWTALLPATLRRAAAIIAVSQSTAADLASLFPENAGKISVVGEAAAPEFQPFSSQQECDRQLDSLGVRRPYVLSVGNLEPRKNLEILLHAFQQAQSLGRLPHQLYLCGPGGWKNKAMMKQLRSDQSGTVRHLGFLPRSHLRALYCCADLLVYPSRMEGFGLPVLEAMACGTAVAAADNSGIREVAGRAARLFETGSVAALRDAIVDTVTNPREIERLRELGLKHAAGFSWDDVARATMAVYRGQGSGVRGQAIADCEFRIAD